MTAYNVAKAQSYHTDDISTYTSYNIVWMEGSMDLDPRPPIIRIRVLRIRYYIYFRPTIEYRRERGLQPLKKTYDQDGMWRVSLMLRPRPKQEVSPDLRSGLLRLSPNDDTAFS